MPPSDHNIHIFKNTTYYIYTYECVCIYIYKHQTTKKDKLVGVIKSNIKTTSTSRPFGMMVCNGPLRWFFLAVLGPSDPVPAPETWWLRKPQSC